MMRRLLAFELRFHTRQPSFIAAALFFTALGFSVSATGFGSRELALTSPYVVMQSLGFVSLYSIFGLAVFCSNAVLRDVDHRMEQLIFTTPVTRFRYLFTRYTGSLVAGLVVMLFAVAGLAAGSLMPWHEPERTGSFSAAAYLWAFAFIAAPNVLLANSVLFATASRTRSALATYVSSIVLLVLYFAGAAYTNSPLMAQSSPSAQSSIVPALADPFGLSAFFHDTRYWDAATKSSELLGPFSVTGANRLLWIAISGVIWAALHATFSFRLARTRRRRETPAASAADAPAARRPSAITTPIRQSATRRWMRAWSSAARLEVRALLRSGPALVLLAVWTALAVAQLRSDLLDTEYGSARIALSSFVVSTLMRPLLIFGSIVIVYFTTEVFWRERQTRIAAVLDATPAPSSAVIAAKWFALVVMLLVLMSCGIAAGVTLQMTTGVHPDAGAYLALLYYAGVPLVLQAAAALLIHSVAPGKYLGLMLVLIVVFVAQFGGLLGLDSHLLRFGTAPEVAFSGMSGVVRASSFHWYMLLWAFLATAGLVAAARMWRTSDGLRARLVRAARGPVVLPAFLIAAAALTGSWIFYNTRVVNRPQSADELNDWRADYERQYHRTESLPQPVIRAVTSTVELFPPGYGLGDGVDTCRIAGTYEIANETPEPVRTTWISVRREARDVSLQIERAHIARHDERFATSEVVFDPPLAPGERRSIRYSLTFGQRGFSDRTEAAIRNNGSFLFAIRFFPTIGYRRSWELGDPTERRKRGLPPLTISPDDLLAAEKRILDRVQFDVTVATAPDQIAVTSGILVKNWRSGGRNWFRYRSEGPILNQFAISSARYTTTRASSEGVAIEVLHDPAHEVNARRIAEITADSVSLFTRAFGEYGARELRVAEVPSDWNIAGLALPNVIILGEERGFLIDDRDRSRPDLLLRRVAHEVAHQWWGYKLSTPDVDGGTALIESITKYAELMLLERDRGRDQVRRLLAMELDRYLRGRSDETAQEPPLYRVRDDQPYLYYGKGALVMYAVRELIGEDAVNRALRSVLSHPRPTTLTLLESLRAVSRPEDFRLIDEWFREIVFHDLQLTRASAHRRADGRYEVRLTIRAAKTAGGSGAAGAAARRPLREHIEIALFAEHPEEDIDRALLLQQIELREGDNEIALTTKAAPAWASLDPRVLRIEMNRDDNVARVAPGL